MATSSDHRAGLHPLLLEKIDRVLAGMKGSKHPMRICQGVRTTAEQQALYAQGRTLGGSVVTNCDGMKKTSSHQLKTDGYGHAVDCCFVGPEPFANSHPWTLYGALVRAEGLTWGGDWHSLVDRPHAELAEPSN